MLQKHSDRALEYLEGKKAMGYKWLTFDGITFPRHLPGLRLFASAIDATRYLNQVNFSRYRDPSAPGFGDNVYAAIDNTIAEIRYSQTGKISTAVPARSVGRLMDEQDFTFIKDTFPERQLLQLAAGGIALASRNVLVRPAEHINGYVVVEQLVTRNREMFNMEKSEVIEHHNSSRLADALKEYTHLTSKLANGPLPVSRKIVLFGKFNEQLEYDPELFLIRGSGIEIASSLFRKGKELRSGPIDLSQSLVHTQSFFVKYDPERKAIETLDDRLIPVTLGSGVASFGGDTYVPAIKGAMLGAVRELDIGGTIRSMRSEDDQRKLGRRP